MQCNESSAAAANCKCLRIAPLRHTYTGSDFLGQSERGRGGARWESGSEVETYLWETESVQRRRQQKKQPVFQDSLSRGQQYGQCLSPGSTGFAAHKMAGVASSRSCSSCVSGSKSWQDLVFFDFFSQPFRIFESFFQRNVNYGKE